MSWITGAVAAITFIVAVAEVERAPFFTVTVTCGGVDGTLEGAV